VLSQLPGQEEPDGGLDVPGGDGGPLDVVSEAAGLGLGCNPLELCFLHLVPVGVDGGEGLVQHGHHGHDLGAHLLTGHALDMWTLSYVNPLSLTEVRAKVDRPSPVVTTESRT
jgi:hypothetical protein